MLKKLFAILIISMLCTFNIIAQTNASASFGNENTFNDSKSIASYYNNLFENNSSSLSNNLMPGFDLDKEALAKSMMEKFALDGPVDPNEYMVGPGDIFQISILGDIPITMVQEISPEGKVVMQSFAVVDVANMSLAEAKKAITEKLTGEVKNSLISVSLQQPRFFTVYVSGIVKNPGSFIVGASNRVDQVVYMANMKGQSTIQEEAAAESKKVQLLRNSETIKYFNEDENVGTERNMSLRNIKIIHRDGEVEYCDLISYYANGELKFNPMLRDGDRVVVQNADLEGNTVTISGAVKLSGEFEYSPFDSLSTMLSIAQGPKANADLSNVDYYYFENNTIKHKKLDLTGYPEGNYDNFKLNPGDRIVVRERLHRNVVHSVRIKGEVNYPGLYPIAEAGAKLSEVIELSGGFNAQASLKEAVVLRFTEPLDKAELNPDFVRMANIRLSELDAQQRQYLNFESTIRRNLLSVDFNKLFVEKDSTQDIILKDGDVILVPEQKNTIYVYGQVVRPGHIQFGKNMSFEDYVEHAGGYSVMADESAARVIKAGSNDWVDECDTELEPGDMIFVPRDIDTDFEYWFNWFSRVVSVIGGVATIILLINNNN